jgi:GTP cyclohydrolase I
VDEKVVTEKAYENPKFSEDIVRDVVLMLQKKYSSFQILTISSTHLESIHQHDAFSIYQGQQK